MEIKNKIKSYTPIYGILFLIVVYLFFPRDYFLINVSESMAKGIYIMQAKNNIKVGDMVLLTCPEKIEIYVYGRKYLPEGIPLLKRVAAVNGTSFFLKDDYFYIDGKQVGRIKSHDKQFLELPVLYTQEEHEIQEEHILVLGDHENSFDSRYFGQININLIRKKAVLLWEF